MNAWQIVTAVGVVMLNIIVTMIGVGLRQLFTRVGRIEERMERIMLHYPDRDEMRAAITAANTTQERALERFEKALERLEARVAALPGAGCRHGD